MRLKVGLLPALAVLLVLMAAMGVQAGNEPPEAPQLPLPGEDPADDVENAGNEGVEDAQEEVDNAQSNVQEALDSLPKVNTDAVPGRDDVQDGQGLLTSLLTTVQSVGHDAVAKIRNLMIDNGIITDPEAAPPLGGGATVASKATEVAPAEATPAAGIALIVAAGAAGGALLWWVVGPRMLAYGLVPMLSRIAKSELYTNDARRLVSELVRSNPGLSLNEVVSNTGYSRNAVSYHLFVLEKEDELVSIKDGKYRRYFPRNGKYVNGAKNVVSVLRNETTLQMAREVFSRPGTIQRELCKELGTTASAACWHAKRLVDLGVVRKERVANTVRYYPGPAAQKYDLSDFGLGPGPSAAETA